MTIECNKRDKRQKSLRNEAGTNRNKVSNGDGERYM